MKLLHKLTINNLLLNKKRTIVTIVGIMLSVGLITAVAAIYSSGLTSLINYEILESGRYHVVFYDLPIEETKVLENNRAVDAVSITKNIGYAEIDSRNEYKPYVYLKGFTTGAFQNLPVRLTDGRFPENENEVLIPVHLMSNGGVSLNIGDTITLEVGKRISADGTELSQYAPFVTMGEAGTPDSAAESIVDTVSRTYTVVGTMERSSRAIEPYSAPGYTLITFLDESTMQGTADTYIHFSSGNAKDALKLVSGFLGINGDLVEKLYRGEDLTAAEYLSLALQAANLKRPLDFNNTLLVLETNPAEISSVSTLLYAVYVVIGIILVTSIFCIKNSFDISISEKIRQYGMLRSIGATKSQIRKNVFFEATILGLFGIPLGLALGFLASFLLVQISNLLVSDLFGAGFSLTFVFSWRAMLVALLLGIVTIYCSALRSAVRASRVTPLDSIRNSAEISINPKKLRSSKIIRKLFGMGGVISHKNIKRNKKKYRTTIVSIAVSVTVFIALSAFMNMAFDETDRELERSEYNISVTASYTDEKEYQQIVETTHLDYVQNATLAREAMIEYSGNHDSAEYSDWYGSWISGEEGMGYITLLAVGDDQFAKYCRAQGLDPAEMQGKGILCDYGTYFKTDEKGKNVTKYMRSMDFQKGDVIEGKINSYFYTEADVHANADGVPVKIQVAAISEERPFGFKNWDSDYLVVSDALFDGMAETHSVRVLYKSDNSDKLQEELDELFKTTDYTLNNNDEEYRRTNNLFTLIGIFLYGFIIVITLIGITNIFNTITTSMELRKQEFAMLRSVGMTNREFSRMIRLESLFMGARALVFGIPIGILLSWVIYHFLSEASGMPFHVPVFAILISVAAVFALILLIMTYSMSKIRKQNTIETIRNENI